MLNKILPTKGSLLISEPFMVDENFKRSVVLLTEHNLEGTVGYILNQKSNYTLKDIIPDCWDANFPVYLGGPVSPDTLHFIHQVPNKIPGGMQIGNQLFWGGDFESLKVQINNYNILENEIRFFIGYSGWSSSQLDDEISINNWIVSNQYQSDLIFNDADENLWKEAILKMGIKYAHIVNFPEDPKLN
jgi:putative transcriptional regulator